MKQIYRFGLTFAGMGDSFYFSNPPTRKDIQTAIKVNRAIAGKDYEEFYENLESLLDQIPDEEFKRIDASSRLCGIGGPIGENRGDCWNSTVKIGEYDTWSLNRYNVIEN